MEQYTISNTKDFRKVFPELSPTDKFKRAIDQVFAHGFTFDLKLSTEPTMGFTGKKGKRFKALLSANGTDKARFLKSFKIYDASLPLNSDNCFDYDESKPVGYSVHTDDNNNQIKVNTYKCRYCDIQKTSWVEIAKLIGLMIGDELVEVEKCSKCNGTGFLPEFAYYADGVCFECMGIGKWFKVKK